jgi:DeoR/GlpR family transcriptional regulator of sugar metabolism
VILNHLKQKSSVTVSELVEELHTSTETIRRDLLHLEKQNRLQRVHGGAVSLAAMKEYPNLSQRLNENREKKEQLSEIAALLVNEGDILAIDAGSTALEFVRILKYHFKNLTIVTNSIRNFEEIKMAEGFKPILVGGEYMQKEDLFCGMLALETIQKLHVSTCFLFPSAVSLKYGVADFIPDVVAVQKAYLDIADRAVITADSSKFEKTALVKICNAASPYTFITSSDLDDNIYTMYRNKGIILIKDKKEIKK